MLHFTRTILIATLFLGITVASFGNDDKNKNDVSENTIASLLEGLTSDNLGLKSGCAYMLGELKVTRAIIPLMRILHNDANEGLRISAALALYKIGTPMSIYAVKQAGKFDESDWVNKNAQNFYAEYLREKFSNTDDTEADSLIAQGKQSSVPPRRESPAVTGLSISKEYNTVHPKHQLIGRKKY